MDGAWALYEAWVKMQTGKADIALVYAYGKSSPGDIRRVHDPPARSRTTLQPLWADSGVAGRPAGPGRPRRRHVHRGADGRGRGAPAGATPRPTRTPSCRGDAEAKALLDEDYFVSPLRKHDCPPITDGAAAVDPRRRRRGPRAHRPAGVDPGLRPPHRAARARRARPHHVGVDRAGRRRRPASPTARSTSPSCTRRSATRSSSCARRSGWATTCRSTRRAARWPPTR